MLSCSLDRNTTGYKAEVPQTSRSAQIAYCITLLRNEVLGMHLQKTGLGPRDTLQKKCHRKTCNTRGTLDTLSAVDTLELFV